LLQKNEYLRNCKV